MARSPSCFNLYWGWLLIFLGSHESQVADPMIEAFHDCFARSEARGHFLDYMVGQYSPLARKSVEPMALAVEGSRIRSLQRFLSETVWDEEQMRWNYHQLVADELGEPDGVLMFDESGFVKKGKDSVGVARQYCGTLGKVENCQVGVFAGYASRRAVAKSAWTAKNMR